ncbi:alpha/beta hydrolase family protein [Actinacidiphila soli]|jgi:acetyl esterase/lipase|uniref:alpha/beta hydrolase family protein n=1 Tax=Actinacidiphila soli TaxID=2487275 RepID=UPI000FCC45BB|nr:alpha/beta hydrolase [Actinacidiphila soli]
MLNEEESALGHAPVPPDATAAYGEHPDQVVDFFRPVGGGVGRQPRLPAPLVVLFHGGAWRAPYDRQHISPLAAFLARRHGFAVASVEYRRGGEPQGRAGRWPDTLDDAAAATDALPELALAALGEDTVDPRRTVLAGHSAGGHLALWAAARHELPPASPWHRSTPPPLRGVVALAPIADLTSARALGVCGDAVVQFLGGPEPEHFEARQPHADPAALLPTGIATTIVQGATDNVVPPQVAEDYATASAKAGQEIQLTLLDGVGHFALIDPSADAAAVVAEEIAQLAW